MYEAELKGKITLKMKRMEDILTSNVFSFLKYTNRTIFLKGFLQKLGLDLTDEEVKNSQFMFWPILSENTEPDLVIIVGDYYLLIEAKFHSDFGKATKNRKNQLCRELEEGKLEAENLEKYFKLITITADYYYKPEKFKTIEKEECFIWTNWQSIATFIYEILEKQDALTNYEIDFANDLYALLVNKNLREYRGIQYLEDCNLYWNSVKRIFFNAGTAKYRGAFIGYKESLSSLELNFKIPDYIFINQFFL